MTPHEIDRIKAEVLRDIGEVLAPALSKALVQAVQELGKNKGLIDGFWESGAEHLFKHSTDKATQWLGRRVLAGIGAALLAAGMFLWGKYGR